MKKYFLVLITIVLITIKVHAAWVENVPITLTQPDGTIINCFASGDEFFNWAHDAEGYPIIRNSAAWYCYAINVNDKMIASKYIVGQSNPASSGISKGVTIPVKEILEKRKAFYEPINVNKKNKSTNNIGNINNIVIFIRFSDETEFPTSYSFYNNCFNQSNIDSNSMYNYFKFVSYEQLFVTSELYPAPNGDVIVSYQDANPRSYYMPYDAINNPTGYDETDNSERTFREHTLLSNAINAVESEIPSNLDYDFNSDGEIDNVCFIVRGAPTAWATLLWPHRWSLFSQTVNIHGLQVMNYNFQIESFFYLPTRGVGVLNHEMFHTLSAPDLYHYDSDYNSFHSVEKWDLMDRSANPSQSMCAWMKYNYGGWIANIPEITTPGYYTLNTLSNSQQNAFQIHSTNYLDEFFVLEYRKDTGVFESSIPGSGLIILRINPYSHGNANFPDYPDEVYVYRPNGIDTINGLIDSAAFSIESGRIYFNNSTNPYTFFSDNYTTADIKITVTEETDSTLTFFYGDFSVGINEMTDNKEINCFPNPAKNIINIESKNSDDDNCNIKIINYLGQIFYDRKISLKSKAIIDVSSFSKGIYMIIIQNNINTTYKKIIVE